MCGITGFISNNPADPIQPRQRRLDLMCEVIRHRGPDEQGTIVKGRAALGMRRLSIIDLKTGQQPIFSEDGNLAIVFNGEIYNYLDIKKDLEARGHRFKTNSDTEVIVRAFEEFGPSCLALLRGMFAFAIWDFDREELFVARDRVGKKPLFYSLSDSGNFVFGSELKTLLVNGAVKREISLAAMDAYLTFGYVPEEFCIFEGAHKLPPAHFLTFKDGYVRVERYWDFDFKRPPQIKSEDEYVEVLQGMVEEAVRVRLISEVPLGAFLSGGVDSASVVAMMARASGAPVKTFSIGFNEDSFNELKYARSVAKEFGTDHHEFIVTPDLVNIVDELVWHFDEPFSDSSALPTYMVTKLAREHVTVALSGDGGDELFGGYTRYLTQIDRARFEMVPRLFRKHLLGQIGQALPHAAWGKNYIYNVSLDPLKRYIDSISQFNAPAKKALYSGEFGAIMNGAGGQGERGFEAIAEAVNSNDPIEQLLYLDSRTYLPGDILTKVDRMSMANSLECRSPLLDHQLIEFVAGVPSEMKINGRETKYLLKKAMVGIVPDEVLHRPKQGFGVPINEWINSELDTRIRDDLTDGRTLGRGYFDSSFIRMLLKEHSSKRRDHSHQLWLLWMLELWHRRYVDV